MVDENYTKPLAYPVPDLSTKLESDVTYKIVDDVELKMDIYSPGRSSTNKIFPVVVFVHGGPIRTDISLKPKDWGVFKSYGKLVASRELVGITLNHRLYAIDNLSKSVSDVNEAIRFLIENNDQYRIDTNRICIWGFSGGGPLLGSIIKTNVASICCWLAFYAHLDLGNIAHQVTDKLSAKEIRQFTTTSILEENDTGNVPMFIARAGKDRPVLNEAIDLFVQKAVEKNRPITFVNHPSGRHGFDVLDNNERTHEIIEMALSFIETNAAKRQ
jgi:acetyl esterase/lipase